MESTEGKVETLIKFFGAIRHLIHDLMIALPEEKRKSFIEDLSKSSSNEAGLRQVFKVYFGEKDELQTHDRPL